MHVMVIAVLAAAAAAYSVGRPPGPSVGPEFIQMMSQHRDRSASLPSNEYVVKYLMPRLLLPRFLGYEESPRIPAQLSRDPEHDWLNKEIERINRMEQGDDSRYYVREYPQFGGETPYARLFEEVSGQDPEDYAPYSFKANSEYLPQQELSSLESDTVDFPTPDPQVQKRPEEILNDADDEKPVFALTPLDEGYFEPDDSISNTSMTMVLDGAHEGGGGNPIELIEPLRHARQNPNLSKAKALVAENLDKFKTTMTNKDFRLPVSLLPTNLRWLRLNEPIDEKESSNEETDSPGYNINMREAATIDPAESLYGVALIAAIGAAFSMTILVFAFGWYSLSKKAKAAADVDYPAYGVTGPNPDLSGDRKLAHSAHMYHYQHQKQQIIAMERNGLEQRNGSMSDPDSEEENEEGDYTVYECPGFATTGDMEVKNPLFAEDPTPATPKRDSTKTQPKE